MPPKHPRAAKANSTTPGNYVRASKPAKPSQLSNVLSLDDSDDDSTAQDTQVHQSTYPSGGIRDAILKGKKVTAIHQPAAGSSKSTFAKNSPTNIKSKSAAEGKNADSDMAVQEITSDEKPGRIKPRNRATSARQTMLSQDPRYFLKERNKKNRRDRKADAQAAAEAEVIEESDVDGSGDEGDEEDGNDQNQDANESEAEDDQEDEDDDSQDSDIEVIDDDDDDDAGSQTPEEAATTKTSAAKSAKSAGKGSAGPTLVKGKITKSVKAKPKPKDERRHRVREFEDDSAPSKSDEEKGKMSSYSRLWDSVNRHAKWCPFVRINKKIQHAHRRIKALEFPPSDDSDDDHESEEEIIKPKSKAEAKKAKPPARKPAAKKAAPKKRTTRKTKTQETDEIEDADIITVGSRSQHPGAEDEEGTGDTDAGVAGKDNAGKSNDTEKQKKARSTNEPPPKDTADAQAESVVNEDININSDQPEADNNKEPSGSDEELSSPPVAEDDENLAAYVRERAKASNGEAPRHVPASAAKSVAATGTTGQKRKASTAEVSTQGPPAKKAKRKSVGFNDELTFA